MGIGFWKELPAQLPARLLARLEIEGITLGQVLPLHLTKSAAEALNKIEPAQAQVVLTPECEIKEYVP